MDAQVRVCTPVVWEQYDGTTVYKCKNVDDSIVTYDAGKFAYCPLCGGRVETNEPMSDAARRVFDRLMSELGDDSDESR